MDCLPAATRGFESEDHASSRGMVHPRRTRSCGEMRGQTRTEERGGALFRRVAGLGQVSSSRGMSLDGAYIQLLYEIREEMNLCPRAEENHEWAR